MLGYPINDLRSARGSLALERSRRNPGELPGPATVIGRDGRAWIKSSGTPSRDRPGHSRQARNRARPVRKESRVDPVVRLTFGEAAGLQDVLRVIELRPELRVNQQRLVGRLRQWSCSHVEILDRPSGSSAMAACPHRGRVGCVGSEEGCSPSTGRRRIAARHARRHFNMLEPLPRDRAAIGPRTDREVGNDGSARAVAQKLLRAGTCLGGAPRGLTAFTSSSTGSLRISAVSLLV